MRALLASLWLMPLTVGLLACGNAVKTRSSGSGSPRSEAVVSDASVAKGPAGAESLAAPVSGDTDGDSAERAAFDSDDFHSMHFGHAADPTQEREIGALVKRYYDALAREDGAMVCSLLLEVVAEALPEGDNASLPEGDSVGASASSASRARSCPAAISGTLARSHRALLAEARTLRVVGVRVRRRRASAILRFAGRAARHILLYKEEGSWKIGTLADEDLG